MDNYKFIFFSNVWGCIHIKIAMRLKADGFKCRLFTSKSTIFIHRIKLSCIMHNCWCQFLTSSNNKSQQTLVSLVMRCKACAGAIFTYCGLSGQAYGHLEHFCTLSVKSGINSKEGVLY